ncbi:FAD-binding protein [Sphingomonas sp. MMS24-JH45]
MIGYGGAGVAAALQARENGLDTIVLDRFEGGGSTAMNGGIYYAGGGTVIQQAAGVADTPEVMFEYLDKEVQGVVSDDTLMRFCWTSAPTMDWLIGHGVAFDLELIIPRRPAIRRGDLPRPSRQYAPLFLRRHPSAGGARAQEPSRSRQRGAGLRARAVRAAERGGRPCWCASDAPHRSASADPGRSRGRHRDQGNSRLPRPSAARRIAEGAAGGREVAADAPTADAWRGPHHGRGSPVRPQGGADRGQDRDDDPHSGTQARASPPAASSRTPPMLAKYAPQHTKVMPIGSLGDDGSGILLGHSAGGSLDRMGLISSWRFLNPPSAWSEGLLVNARGERLRQRSQLRGDGGRSNDGARECAVGWLSGRRPSAKAKRQLKSGSDAAVPAAAGADDDVPESEEGGDHRRAVAEDRCRRGGPGSDGQVVSGYR